MSDEGPGRGDRSSGGEADAAGGFGRQGWLLVAAVFGAFILVPGVIYFSESLGVPFRVAYLVLPLVPAVVLALVAVWVTTTP